MYRRAERIFRRALLVLPDCTLLHLAYAELLEARHGPEDPARARNLFVALVKKMPSSDMAWAMYERFVRRVEGVQSARQVFRLTRRARIAGELGHPTYLAHALLEWYTNGQPEVALRVFR